MLDRVIEGDKVTTLAHVNDYAMVGFMLELVAHFMVVLVPSPNQIAIMLCCNRHLRSRNTDFFNVLAIVAVSCSIKGLCVWLSSYGFASEGVNNIVRDY